MTMGGFQSAWAFVPEDHAVHNSSQAIRNMLPAIGNEFVTLIKESSLLSTLAITELTMVGQQVRSVTYASFETFIVVGIIYLVLTSATQSLPAVHRTKVERQLKKPQRRGERAYSPLRPFLHTPFLPVTAARVTVPGSVIFRRDSVQEPPGCHNDLPDREFAPLPSFRSKAQWEGTSIS